MRIHVVEAMKLDEKQKRRLKKLGEVTYFDGMPTTDELVTRCGGAEIVCANWAPIDEAIPRMGSGVRLIAVPFTGVGWLPLKEAADKGIRIANAPGYGTESVGEFGIGLMLCIARGIHEYGNAQPEPRHYPSLYKKRILVLGRGRIGSYVAKVSKALGMKVSLWVRGDNLMDLIKDADVVYSALPLNDQTKGLLGEREFGAMKEGSFFVSTSHEKIYDHKALLKALSSNLAGAAMDLEGINAGDYKSEVYTEFKYHPKILVTPHIAWKSDYAVRKGFDIMIDNIEAFIRGSPANLVN
jgi:phosphoglycerate dehydrogenase-like enzyme